MYDINVTPKTDTCRDKNIYLPASALGYHFLHKIFKTVSTTIYSHFPFSGYEKIDGLCSFVSDAPTTNYAWNQQNLELNVAVF